VSPFRWMVEVREACSDIVLVGRVDSQKDWFVEAQNIG